MSLGPGTSALTPTVVDPPRTPARSATVAAQFDRRALRYAAHDAIAREVERRLLERLDLIRLDPQRIVDVGCGRATSAAALAARYPRARWLGVDRSRAMLGPAVAGGWAGWLQRLRRRPTPARVLADAGALPLADASVDLVLSNLMLHWHPVPHTVFPEWKRVLRTGGLLLFSCFGPDTLREVRAAFAVWPAARPMPFIDMHDFGDMMVGAGLATPVMDVERITLTYPSARALLREVAALGGNPRDDRPAALPAGAAARAVLAALAAQADAAGRCQLTFEVAYGHAWRPAPRPTAAVPLETLRRDLRQRARAGTAASLGAGDGAGEVGAAGPGAGHRAPAGSRPAPPDPGRKTA